MSEAKRSRKQTPGRFVRRLLQFVLITWVLVVIVLGFFQRKLLYHPRRAETLLVADFPALSRMFPAASNIAVTCRDGVTIRGWLLQKEQMALTADSQTRPLVIFFHGNGGNRAGRMDWYQMIEAAGADVLAVDYHGYGDSAGTMSESALEMDAEATWAFATSELGYHASDIILMGTSLGGAAAVLTASEQSVADSPPAALITVASFSSMVDVAGSLYPWLPVSAVLVDRYPSDQRIGSVTCPIVMLHGDRDSLVDYAFGRKLFDAAPARASDGTPKLWVSMPEVNHNNLPLEGGGYVRPALNDITQHWRNGRS